MLPKGIGDVRRQNGYIEYFSGLSTQRAPVPGFGGNTTVAGRFSNQIVVDRGGNVVLQNPEPGKTGNLGLALSGDEGPGRLGFDAALEKRIRFAEKKTFSIRADAVNVLNRPIFDNPNTDINSATFGRITSASGSRTLIINARVDF